MSQLRIADCGLRIVALALVLAAAATAAMQTAAKGTGPAEALKEVDALLKQTSEITGLPIKHPVKSAVTGRDDIQKYIQGRITQTIPPEKVHALEVALKEFGLLPKVFALEEFMVKLLTEQAAAYYDPQKKAFFVADWTPIELQRPAIVHELTHALQDQQVDLDEFLQAEGLNQDEQTARSAVVEGGGALAMVDFLLAQAGIKREAAPRMDEFLSAATSAELQKFPVFSSAPLYLRESLLFPYTAGMMYMSHQVRKHGKAAYAMSLTNPPRSTAEILHPERAPEKTENPEPPKPAALPEGYKLIDEDVLGEFDVQILLRVHAGEEMGKALSPFVRGFSYALYEKDASQAFVTHRSRWADARTAKQFAGIYRKVIDKKKRRNGRVEVSGDMVSVIEQP